MEEIGVHPSRLCRTCNTERSHMSPLSARDPYDDLKLGDMLIECTNLKILEGDGFPDSICDWCVTELKSAYRFKRQCEAADWHYKRLGLIGKRNSDRTRLPTVHDKLPDYDYVKILEDDSAVFACRECCWTFDTTRELKNHKVMHSENEIKEEKRELLIFTESVVSMEGENKERLLKLKQEQESEEEHFLESKREEENHAGGQDDSNSLFFKEYNDTKRDSAMSVTFTEGDIEEKGDQLEGIKKIDSIRDNNVEGNPHSNTRQRRFICNICEKPFSTRSSCDRHERTHDPNNRFECDVCGKSYAYVCNLRQHQRTHRKRKQFKCDICEKSYAYRSELLRHERTHSGNDRFECDACGKSYAYVCNLRQHALTHCANVTV